MHFRPKKLILLVLAGCLASAAATAADYHIAANGSDGASGSATQPFKTIQRGIDAAGRPGDTVTIHPGVYHEELMVRAGGTAERTIAIKAAEKGTVILDGARRIQGWRLLDGALSVWEVDLDSPAPYNNGQGRWDMPPRSEQLFVDGKRCTHLKEGGAPGAMADYSFTATLATPARYRLKLPRGVNPDQALTEVSVKASLLELGRSSAGVLIDGLTFRRARDTYQGSMVTLRGEGHEIRNCLFEYSSAGSGLGVQSRRCRIHDCTFRANGQFGFTLAGVENILENNLVEGNDLAGYKEWGTGGTKIVGNGCIVRHNRFIGNLGGVAIWLDCGPCDNVIEGNYVSGNFGEGIRSEISFHNYIGYNIVELTRECTSTMFGKTQTHCIGISVQNSAETIVCNNFLKDNGGPGIQLFAYNRKASDLPAWQRYNKRQIDWLKRSHDSGIIYANDNKIFNNVIVQSVPQSADACIWWRGPLNGENPHNFGNEVDCNFYWNSVTHAPKVKIKNLAEVPGAGSQWRTQYGLDAHGGGGFAPADYARPAFGAQYPYLPAAGFPGLGQGKPLGAFPGHQAVDFLGHPAGPGVGHIQ